MTATESAAGIMDRLEHGIRESERAVLLLGETIDHIVRLATAPAAGPGGEAAPELAIAGRIDGMTAAADGFIEQTRAFLRRQVEFARAANDAFRHIYKTATGVSDLTAKSRLLALNLQIEAVRTGDCGALRVIGQEMVQFSHDIRSANGAIIAALDGLSNSLPQLEAEAVGMDAEARAFSAAQVEQLGAVRAGVAGLRDAQADGLRQLEERNREIVGHANRALSALQFHDPLAQDLRAAMRLLGDPEGASDAPLARSSFGDTDAARVAGELELF